ncbi:MAG: RNA polymerase sigma factor [Planctomycetota bacterium]
MHPSRSPTPDPATPSSEEASLIAAAQRDPRAFAALYRAYYGVIAAYARRRIRDPHVADDVVAEVFMEALRHLPRYRHRGLPFRAWLYRIATTRLHRWARRERRRPTAPLAAEPAATDASSAEADAVRAALVDLPPRWQSVLSLHYLEGLSVAEVAAVLGLRAGTVKSRLHRGRAALAARLRQERA